VAIDDLRPTARDVSWVAPGNLHLTVKFLGEVADGRIEGIVGALTGAIAGVSAFDADVEASAPFRRLCAPAWCGPA